VRRFAWRGALRPHRPLRSDEVTSRRAPFDPAREAKRVACREYYAALRAAGLCVKCKAPAPVRSECVDCRRKRHERAVSR
jgi:hypothetical protein